MVDKIHQSRILIVDDEEANIVVLERVLRAHDYTNVMGLQDSRGFFAMLVEYQPDLIVLDLTMPHIDGFQLLRMLSVAREEHDYLPVLVVSALDDHDSKHAALSGGATDYLAKPYDSDEVCDRILNLLNLRLHSQQLQKEVRKRTRELEQNQLELKQAQLEIIFRLARAAEHRDDDTGKHTQRVGLLCALVARALGWPEHRIQLLHHSAPLHDVGKIGISDSILLKPGRFTDAERVIMQGHCRIGADMLAGGQSDVIRLAETIARSHHERWDGFGYPLKLAGANIPHEGRILAVVDVFDALTHARPYKKAWPLQKALDEIAAQRGTQFDPEIVDCFLSLPTDELQPLCGSVDEAQEASVA